MELIETNEAPVSTSTPAGPKYKTMGLSECGKFDHDNGLANKITGWGRISKERCAKRQSKRGEARRKRKNMPVPAAQQTQG